MLHENWRRLCAAAVFAWLVAACSSPEERFANHLERADTLALQDQREAATLEYRSALKLDPESVEANERLSIQLQRSGDPSANFYLREALRLDPARVDLSMRQARVMMAAKRLDEAESLIESTLAANADDAVVLAARAELLLYQSDPDGALEVALRATELAPDDPAIWVQLGRVYVGQIRMAQLRDEDPDPERVRKAVEAFERGDDIAGGLVAARMEQGHLLRTQRKTRDKAAAAYAAAVELAVDQGDVYAHMVAAMAAEAFAEETGMRDFQTWALREMIHAHPEQLPLWRKLARQTRGSTEAVGRVYAELIEKRPDDPAAHSMYVAHLMNTGQERAARRHIRERIEAGGASPRLWEQLIGLQIRQRRLANARASFVRMSDEYPDSPMTRHAEARFALAEGRNSDAVEILRAILAQSESFETQRMLAMAEFRSGNLEEASTAIDRALAIQTEFAPETRRLKARIHGEAGDWRAVLATLSWMARNGATITDLDHLLRARALYELGRRDDARQVLDLVVLQAAPLLPAVLEFSRREGSEQATRARLYLSAAAERYPAHTELVEAWVDLELSASDPRQALAVLNDAVDTGRAKPQTLLLRAYVLKVLGELPRAEADALRAFEADPSLPGAADLLFTLYTDEEKLDETRRSFEEADAAGVLHPGARLLLGRIYLEQGDTDRALATVEKVVSERPTMSVAKRNLAYALAVNDRDLDRALQLAQEARRSMPRNAGVADTVGYVYYRKGQPEAALEQFEHAVELNRHKRNQLDPTLHYHLGLALHALDREADAQEAFRRALELDANFRDADDARRRVATAPRPS
jgi:tetratricopeptide (TPR) repeat protein